jgi:putative membrane protein
MRRVAVGAATLVLAGCASNAPQPARQYPAAPPLREAPASAATYVAQAASIDLFVIRSSELANLRSVTPAIRQYADRMIADHRGLASQLSLAGRRLDLLPSATLLPQHQAMLDELAASSNFEAAYLRLQRQVHGQGLALHGNYAAHGESATLRPVAASATAVERRHLDMLRNLRL